MEQIDQFCLICGEVSENGVCACCLAGPNTDRTTAMPSLYQPRWEPIETAPTGEDAPMVLVYGDRSSYAGNKIDVAVVMRLRDGTFYGETPLSSCEGIGGIMNPTHWMPLPEPPK
jgi:hypothetical protein